jgi:hypothetical protein
VGILDGYKTPSEAIKALQQALRTKRGRKPKIPALLVLNPEVDPYYAGNGVLAERAHWFAELWERFGFSNKAGVHLRRAHYRIYAEGNVCWPDGTPYENTKRAWGYMQQASRQARYMGLVNPEAIIDRRNPKPHIYLGPGAPYWEEQQAEPGWAYEFTGFDLPGLDVPRPLLDLPELHPIGYDYHGGMQRYHVEVWAEKTTMDDILRPLCRATATNYVSGAGYQSVTAMVGLLRHRAQVLNKPVRVLYISDYDAAGQNMPKQMARHIQFWSERYGTDYDIRVEPIVMTAKQSEKYPPDPETGAVELDAMAAYDPGLLAHTVRQAITPFRDGSLRDQAARTKREAAQVLEDEFEGSLADDLRELREIEAEASAVYERYREGLVEVAEEMERELTPLRTRLHEAEQSLTEGLNALDPDLPDLPKGATTPPGADEGWLFDSRRGYMKQLGYYKRS